MTCLLCQSPSFYSAFCETHVIEWRNSMECKEVDWSSDESYDSMTNKYADTIQKELSNGQPTEENL